MTTLWDKLRDHLVIGPKPVAPVVRHPTRTPVRQSRAQLRYETMQREMLARYHIRVRKWRNSTSGVAWQVIYADGTIARIIESPRPRGPVSAAVFLHEVGHHAIGFNIYTPRCLEERQAWCFALDQMEAWNLTITDAVRKRVHHSLVYAVAKAQRRGIKNLPAVLVPYLRDNETGSFLDPRSSDASGPS